MKERTCPHGNLHDQKDDVRKDSVTAQLHFIRLLLALAAILKMRLGIVDIIGADMRSGPIKRKIYERPRRECILNRVLIFNLLRLPYGTPEAGR